MGTGRFIVKGQEFGHVIRGFSIQQSKFWNQSRFHVGKYALIVVSSNPNAGFLHSKNEMLQTDQTAEIIEPKKTVESMKQQQADQEFAEEDVAQMVLDCLNRSTLS